MIIEKLLSCGLAACFACSMQSLVDLAHQEAERRKALEGVEEKVIQGNPQSIGPDANLTTSSTAATRPKEKTKSPAQNGSGIETRFPRIAVRTAVDIEIILHGSILAVVIDNIEDRGVVLCGRPENSLGI